MRNIFDQYEQPENRLTHALMTTLHRDRSLLIPFLKYLGINDIPPSPRKLKIEQQQAPGTHVGDAHGHNPSVPDAVVFDDEHYWAVLFECKVQAKLIRKQLCRHRKTAQNRGFQSPWLVVITVNERSITCFEKTICVTWRDLYKWFSQAASPASFSWAAELVGYMQVFERRMLAEGYDIKGTITMFDGLRFDDKNPYTYDEGKRLIRLLGDQLQQCKELHAIGVDPVGKRRSKITGKGTDEVWDFLPFKAARGAKHATDSLHLTIRIGRSNARAAVTVPDKMKGGFRSRLKTNGVEHFKKIIRQLEKSLRPIVAKHAGVKPVIYASQRHYLGSQSKKHVDAQVEADLRTAVPDQNSPVKYQPEWIEAIYQLLVDKKSNIQVGVEMVFPYSCKVVRSPEAGSLFVQSWLAMKPFIDFVSGTPQHCH